MTSAEPIRESSYQDELRRLLYLAAAKRFAIPMWVLLGFPSEAEWLLTSLFRSAKEIEDDSWIRRGASHYGNWNHRVD